MADTALLSKGMKCPPSCIMDVLPVQDKISIQAMLIVGIIGVEDLSRRIMDSLTDVQTVRRQRLIQFGIGQTILGPL